MVRKLVTNPLFNNSSYIAPDKKSELTNFWLAISCILLNLTIVHWFLDETLVGPIGLILLTLGNAFVLLFINKGKDMAFPVYWSLALLTVAVAWYMMGPSGIRAPTAVVAFIIPGIAYYMLGGIHLAIWIITISSLYSYVQFFDIPAMDIPLPTVAEGNESLESWAVNLIMLNAVTFLFYALTIMRKRLRQEARTDSLTNSLNRRGITKKIEHELSVYSRHKNPFSIIIIDADNFKNINDTYGHSWGDLVLIDLVKVISGRLRDIDYIGRWGGEEFLVLLPHTDTKGAKTVAESMREDIEKLKVRKEGEDIEVRFTISIGVSTIDDTDETIEAVINRADNALYEAKETGRNKVICSVAKD
jgi:diguanylate cyclase (GGDEF)-like protein